ncbi:hypothetical protein EVJ50_12875 [Synechococcus sp. RSCCF101]|uniref:hypothetical protein n=1 Tax=Synechococcus sp. RSCCF101 TaxID=2511069 RepID=UPI001246D723|nr:hypothetical protein [Synechococcus sp. RSCCF101]QEY32989.1 hypothetical protein EVJ50_12875 [Synechococcus sp. RSCCF101]
MSRRRPGWLAGAAALLLSLLPLTAGCRLGGSMPRSAELRAAFAGTDSQRDPSLGGNWLAAIVQRRGRDAVVLLNLKDRRPVPLPGLNRPDAQPVAVAVDARGSRLALIRRRQGRTEVVLYRREAAAAVPIALEPDGVPRALSLRADGRQLAVQVSRGGRWQVDLIALP